MYANPFVTPGSHGRPTAPLNPWKEPRDIHYYVDIDNAESSFELFTGEFDDLDPLRRDGRLVLVTGEAGCGKSALINRCAYWLREKAKAAGLEPFVIDATPVAVPEQNQDTRLKKVSGAVVRRLWQSKTSVVTDGRLRDFESSPEEAYDYLPGAIRNSAIVIVVLPKMDVLSEIENYARFVRERILFLAEFPYVDQDTLDRIKASGALHLSVTDLRTDDGDIFANHRFDNARDDHIPRFAADTLTRVLSRRAMSIGEFQKLLLDLYNDLLTNEEFPSEITYEHITDFYFAKFKPASERARADDRRVAR